MKIINSQIVTTRKKHNCWGCMREFPKGTDMERVTGVADIISTVYWCEDCQELLKKRM